MRSERGRSEQDGEQAQDGRDQMQEACEQREQEWRRRAFEGWVARLTQLVYTLGKRMATVTIADGRRRAGGG